MIRNIKKINKIDLNLLLKYYKLMYRTNKTPLIEVLLVLPVVVHAWSEIL